MVDDVSPERLGKSLEVLHFAFRGLIAEPDSILKTHGLSRIHHRLLFFINRYSGLSVNELVETMRLTKQAIHKPLKLLVTEGYVGVARDTADKRVKRLTLTEKGNELEHKLSDIQYQLMNSAFLSVGPEGTDAWFAVMDTMARRLGL